MFNVPIMIFNRTSHDGMLSSNVCTLTVRLRTPGEKSSLVSVCV